jgi:hypothetical protein
MYPDDLEKAIKFIKSSKGFDIAFEALYL